MNFFAINIRTVGVMSTVFGLAACSGDEALQSVGINGNIPPVIAGSPPTRAIMGAGYSFTPVASDADGDPLIFAIDGRPAWLNFNPQTGALSGQPGATDIGMHRGIIVSVSDGKDDALLPAFDVLVEGPASNRPPVISGVPSGSATVGNLYDFIPTVSDADGDPLSFLGANVPVWAILDPATGRLSGAPGPNNVGVFGNITINVSDGLSSAALGPFLIVVNPPPSSNAPPTITGVPPTSVLTGVAYNFQPVATDADGDPLSYLIFGQPAWAQFDSTTGTLSGTPDATHVGPYPGIGIVVTDGSATASIGPFTIDVLSSNSAPVISGTPAASVTEGNAYSFTPSATDPNGDTLTFLANGIPSWATFTAATGSIQGTPGPGDVRTYNGISITVSDGSLSDTLGPYSIDVVAVATGSATLSWAAPTLNTDGSPLTDLAGYEVHYGSVSGSYSAVTILPNPGLVNFVVDNLLSGTTYYFSMKAYNQQNVRSDFAGEASKAIP